MGIPGLFSICRIKCMRAFTHAEQINTLKDSCNATESKSTKSVIYFIFNQKKRSKFATLEALAHKLDSSTSKLASHPTRQGWMRGNSGRISGKVLEHLVLRDRNLRYGDRIP